MPDPPHQLRLRIRALQTRRRVLESRLLQPQSMLSASLIERFLGSPSSRRATPAYYLSRSQRGRSKLTYVKKQALASVRRQCEAYRVYQQNLTAWRRLTVELASLWKQLQRRQSI